MRLVIILALALVAARARASPFATFSIVNAVVGLVLEVTDIAVNIQELTSSGYKELPPQFNAVAASIQRIERDMGSVTLALGQLKNMEEVVQREISWGHTVETMENLLRHISSKYDRFLFYQQNSGDIERHTLEDFATEAVSHNTDSLQSTMYSLRDLVMGSDLVSTPPTRRKRYAFKAGLFRELKSRLMASKKVVCALKHSPQQLVYSLYGILAVALAKHCAMIQFSYMLLRLLGKGSFTVEQQNNADNYRNISLKVAAEASSTMQDLPGFFWRCDPAEHVEGATYEQVTELLQGYMVNEADISQTGSCTGKCSDFQTARSERCFRHTKLFHETSPTSHMLCGRQRRCSGTLHRCRFVASSPNVCFPNTREGKHRRYNWIKFTDGQTLGRTDAHLASCAGTHQADSWLRGFMQCSYCFCLCDDDTSSDRYFSLLPAVSDVVDNKIVTGVRFVKERGIFYIQLEHGTADQFGYVNASTVQWKPIDRHVDINREKAGRDFFKLSWEQHSVHLQDLRAPPGHVITGVSFHTVGGHLSLKIQVTAISASSANLAQGSSVWIASNDIQTVGTQLDLGSDLDLPTRGPVIDSWPDSQSGQSVQFSASSMKLDAAQTTLPFLDIQPVAPRPAVWLAGLGLYHKGREGSGGFIGLRVQMADPRQPRDTLTSTRVRTSTVAPGRAVAAASGGLAVRCVEVQSAVIFVLVACSVFRF